MVSAQTTPRERPGRTPDAAAIDAVGLELLMAVALTAFGVFVASRIKRMEGFSVVMQLLLFPMLFLSGGAVPAQRAAGLAGRDHPDQPAGLRG
jgi:ABC-2 type transporter